MKEGLREDNFAHVIATLLGVQKNIFILLDFAHVDRGQCSCASNLESEPFRKKCEKYLV